MQVDLVSIGAGGTGLGAACAAVEAGLSAVVFEKRPKIGGNSLLGTGIFATESPVLERLNMHASSDEMFRIAMEYSHWSIDPILLRTFIDRSGETVAWLEDMGVDFYGITPLAPDQLPPTWHCPRGGGPAIVDAMAAFCTDRGAEIITDAAVTEILIEDGQVTGVVVARRDGEQLRVASKAVVIGTGGFGGNKEMLRKWVPGYQDSMPCLGVPHEGDGIQMALRLGAGTEGLGHMQYEAPSTKGSLFLNLCIREPGALIVNGRGRRFMDEALVDNPFESANALMRQPGKYSWTIFDESQRREILRKGKNKALGPLYEDQMRKPELFDNAIRPREGKIVVADSLEDLAESCGIDPAVLTGTVDEYNQAARAGRDPVFAKPRRFLTPLTEGPYYAIRGELGYLETMGGIRINEQMRVLADDGSELARGLFAGGADAGGWESETYCFRLAGSSFGFAINSGRIAGEQAALDKQERDGDR